MTPDVLVLNGLKHVASPLPRFSHGNFCFNIKRALISMGTDSISEMLAGNSNRLFNI